VHYETTVPTVKDRVVQMAVKWVIEPLFEADFMPCSFGFRPEKTPRMALSIIAEKTQAGYTHVVDVDLKSYFDTISHELLLELVERRVGERQVVRLIRAGLKAGVREEGQVTHPDRGCPQGGVIFAAAFQPHASRSGSSVVSRRRHDESFCRAGWLRGR